MKKVVTVVALCLGTLSAQAAFADCQWVTVAGADGQPVQEQVCDSPADPAPSTPSTPNPACSYQYKWVCRAQTGCQTEWVCI